MQEHGGHAPCFQEEFVLLVAAMGPIPDNGVEDMIAMPADLVGSACEGPGFDERVAGGGVLAKGDGHLGLVQSPEYRHCIAGLAFVVGDGIVDRDLLGKPPAHQGQVAFVHPSGHELILNGPGHLRIEGEEQDAPGLPVDAMTGVDMSPHQLAAQDLHGKLFGIQSQVGPVDQ